MNCHYHCGHRAGQVLLPGHHDIHQGWHKYAARCVFAATQITTGIYYCTGRDNRSSRGILTTGRQWTSSVIVLLRSESLSCKTISLRRKNDGIEDIFARDPIVYHGGWVSQICYYPAKNLRAYCADHISGLPLGHDPRANIHLRHNSTSRTRESSPRSKLPSNNSAPSRVLGTAVHRRHRAPREEVHKTHQGPR